MKRFPAIASPGFALLLSASLLVIGLLGSETQVLAQEITITVKQEEKKGKPDAKPPFHGQRPSVDVAILLDTSNSMDGLINQAKTQLWKIVQQFAEVKKHGQTPTLRVSVFEYGNTGLPAREGYIRQVVQLTNDLDKVSEAIFGLKTNGGDEYCGMVIQAAIERLDWSSEPNAYKAIFIAGNEPFTQGSVDYKEACKQAIESGVVVNTIHCGDYQSGIRGMWKQGASIAEGEYLNIDQDQTVVHIKSPQDKLIIELNVELNKTYLWYGKKQDRRSYQTNQVTQDANAMKSSGASGFGSGRGKSKISSVYRNVGRDLVDSLEQDAQVLSKIATADLPEEMQAMDAKEREQHLKKMATQRDEIKKKMRHATQDRDDYIAKKRQEQGETESTLGDAVSQAVQKQLKASGFQRKTSP